MSDLEFVTWKFPGIEVCLYPLNLKLVFRMYGDPLLSSVGLGMREHKHCPSPRRSGFVFCLQQSTDIQNQKPRIPRGFRGCLQGRDLVSQF